MESAKGENGLDVSIIYVKLGQITGSFVIIVKSAPLFLETTKCFRTNKRGLILYVQFIIY
jgi:hypothetical protein